MLTSFVITLQNVCPNDYIYIYQQCFEMLPRKDHAYQALQKSIAKIIGLVNRTSKFKEITSVLDKPREKSCLFWRI